MIGPIAFYGNAEAAQATQQVAAPEQAAVQEQPVVEQPLPQPAQDTFSPGKAEAAPQADPNDQFVKAEQPAEQKEKED